MSGLVADGERALAALVEMALAEDVGRGDLTVAATVPPGTVARARIVQKAPGVVFGLAAVDEVFSRVGVVEVSRECEEGEWRDPGDEPLPVANLAGPADEILTGERTALNFLAHLSGVATLTARFVEAVRGTGARILDTRKTTPGMRLLEKAAVVAGGGANHRIGLFDAVLIKENHIALAGGVTAAVRACREAASGAATGGPMVEVECETLEQLREALAAGADRILLDNMDLAAMREAVAIRNREAGPPPPVPNGTDPGEPNGADPGGNPLPGGILLEASGGITLDNVRQVAETGVDLISIGALTHSAPSLDLSMLVAVD